MWNTGARCESAADGWGEVTKQHFRGPLGLPDLAARSELAEPRLDIKDRRSVDRVEIFNVKIKSIGLDEPAA